MQRISGIQSLSQAISYVTFKIKPTKSFDNVYKDSVKNVSRLGLNSSINKFVIDSICTFFKDTKALFSCYVICMGENRISIVLNYRHRSRDVHHECT